MVEDQIDTSPFVTVTKDMRGWVAIQFCYNSGGTWEFWAIGENFYATQEEAREDAKNWAINDEMRYVE